MKKHIIIAIAVLLLIISAAVILFAVFGETPKNTGTGGTTAGTEASTTAEVKPPEIPEVTDEKYFNFIAIKSKNEKNEEYTYYTISAKSVDDLPETLVIPSEHNGCEVRHIVEGGFAGAKIKKVYISGGLYSLSQKAFFGCTELREVTVSDFENVLFIGISVFEGCEKLESVYGNIPSGLCNQTFCKEFCL